MGGSGDLVFSDDAADAMTSALRKARQAVGDLKPADPGEFDVGDSTVIGAASDLFIHLYTFGQGLSAGIAHCEASVSSSREALAAIDKQLESAASARPARKSSARPARKSRPNDTKGWFPLGNSGLTAKIDLDTVAGTPHEAKAWGPHQDQTESESPADDEAGSER